MRLLGTRLALCSFLLFAVGTGFSLRGAAQGRPGWEEPPSAYGDAQRQGFHDGQVGARRDADNHRRPDPNNREEYRSPRVPAPLWEEYREGFRRGYELVVAQMMGEFEEGHWREAPHRYGEIERRGYADGQVGAERDADNRRRPDPNNREEYRSPHVPPEAVEAYREGFRRGYEVETARLYGGAGYR